jgi:hypothetical protein
VSVSEAGVSSFWMRDLRVRSESFVSSRRTVDRAAVGSAFAGLIVVLRPCAWAKGESLESGHMWIEAALLRAR